MRRGDTRSKTKTYIKEEWTWEDTGSEEEEKEEEEEIQIPVLGRGTQLLAVCFDMTMEVTQLSKRLGTLVTPVGLLTSVCPDVGPQVILLWKGLWTVTAGKGTLT